MFVDVWFLCSSGSTGFLDCFERELVDVFHSLSCFLGCCKDSMNINE